MFDWTLGGGLVVGLVLLNLWVTGRALWAEGTEVGQRFLLIALTWLVPIIGAILTLAILKGDATRIPREVGK